MLIMIIDRFEDEFAVAETEDGERVRIEKKLLPQETREGDCVTEENGKFIIDKEKTEQRRNKIIELQNNLWE